MVDGKTFQLNNLIQKYENLNKSFDNNDLEIILSNFKDYLYEVFPVREKILKNFKNQPSEFLALKVVYNLFKHKCNIDLLLSTHHLISNKSYPYTYPYRYGQSGIVFCDFTNVFNSAIYKNFEKKENDLNLCNQVLKGKEVINIIKVLHEDTIKHLNQKY